MSAQPPSRIKVADELRVVLGHHETRFKLTLEMAIKTAESLQTTFETYVQGEVDDIASQIRYLDLVNRDMTKEKTKLAELARSFKRTNAHLTSIISSAREGMVVSIAYRPTRERESYLPSPLPEEEEPPKTVTELNVAILMDAFQIIGEVEELREEVERWSRSFVRDVDDVLSVVDERLSRGS
jgi:hypothetical protein